VGVQAAVATTTRGLCILGFLGRAARFAQPRGSGPAPVSSRGEVACAAVLPVRCSCTTATGGTRLPSFLAIVGLFTFAQDVPPTGAGWIVGLVPLRRPPATRCLGDGDILATVYGALGVDADPDRHHLSGVNKDAESESEAPEPARRPVDPSDPFMNPENLASRWLSAPARRIALRDCEPKIRLTPTEPVTSTSNISQHVRVSRAAAFVEKRIARATRLRLPESAPPAPPRLTVSDPLLISRG